MSGRPSGAHRPLICDRGSAGAAGSIEPAGGLASERTVEDVAVRRQASSTIFPSFPPASNRS
jgi:hypothetical protein